MMDNITSAGRVRCILEKSSTQCIILFVLAAALRLYRFRAGETFVSSDEVWLFQYSIKPLIAFLSPETSVAFIGEQLFRFSNFSWGWGFLFVSTLNVLFLTLLHIPITEVTIILPYVMVGSACAVVAYLLGRLLKNKTCGFIAGAMVALTPVHISVSRSIGSNAVAASLFFLLSLFFLIKYLKTKTKKDKFIAYAVVGYYISTDFLFYVTIPVMLLAGLFYSKKTIIEYLKDIFLTKALFLVALISLPTILSAIYLVKKGLTFNTYFLHPFTKESYMGFFLDSFSERLLFNFGTGLFILSVLGFCYSVWRVLKFKDKDCCFLLVWFAMTTLPFIIIVNPKYTFTSLYILHAMLSITFMAAIFLSDFFEKVLVIKNKFTRITLILTTSIILCVILLNTITITAISVFGVDGFQSRAAYTFGYTGQNSGIKTAGHYFRENVSSDENVFVDTELFVGQYYLGREVLGDLDLAGQQILDKYYELKLNSTRIDWITLEKSNTDLFKEELKKEHYAVCTRIMKNGKLVREIFRKGSCSVVDLKTEETDLLFDKKYGNIYSLFFNY